MPEGEDGQKLFIVTEIGSTLFFALYIRELEEKLKEKREK